MTKKFALLIISVLLMGLFTACEYQVQNPQEAQVIRICIDNEYMYGNMRHLETEFSLLYPEVELEWQILSSGPDADTQNERDAALTALRVELASGKGPDLLLMTTASHLGSEPMFPDINKVMQNGYFTDLAPLLAQHGIQGQDFLAPLMAATQYEGTQVVWPLGYAVRGYIVEDTAAARYGLYNAATAKELLSALEAASETAGAAMLFHTGMNPLYTAFEPLLDYNTGTVLLDTPYVRDMLSWGAALHTPGAENLYTEWLLSGQYDALRDSLTLRYVTATNLQSEVLGAPDDIYQAPVFVPLVGEAGGITAELLYCAAIPAGSENADGAATLLAFLLEPEQQSGAAYAESEHGSSLDAFPARNGCLSALLAKPVQSQSGPALLYESLLSAENRITGAVIRGHTPTFAWQEYMLRYWNGEIPLEQCLQQAANRLALYMGE